MIDDIEKQKKFKNNYKKEVIELKEELAIVKAELETIKEKENYNNNMSKQEKQYRKYFG